jgi:hypothetical protein
VSETPAGPSRVHVDRVQLGVLGAPFAVAVRAVAGPAEDLAVPLDDQVHHAAVAPSEPGAAALGVLLHAERVEERLGHEAPVRALPAPDPDLGDAVAVGESHLADEERVVHDGTLGTTRPPGPPLYPSTTANASTSSRNSARTSAATWTAEAVGRCAMCVTK